MRYNGYWFDWRHDEAARAAMRHAKHHAWEQRQTEERHRYIGGLLAVTTVCCCALVMSLGIMTHRLPSEGNSTAVNDDASTSTELVSASAAQNGICPMPMVTTVPVSTALASMVSAAWLSDEVSEAVIMAGENNRSGEIGENIPSRCTAMYSWPVEEPRIEQRFDGPASPWLPGHRGVDLMAEQGTGIVAPKAGTVSFAGKVAGKHVVSIRHDNGVTSTFEPATTTLNVGSRVTRNQPVATVEGDSDHCEDHCLHWGLRRSATDYLDPQRYTGNRKIALKPMDGE